PRARNDSPTMASLGASTTDGPDGRAGIGRSDGDTGGPPGQQRFDVLRERADRRELEQVDHGEIGDVELVHQPAVDVDHVHRRAPRVEEVLVPPHRPDAGDLGPDLRHLILDRRLTSLRSRLLLYALGRRLVDWR